MAPKLYIDKLSPPCRAVLMCGRAIGLDMDIVEVNLLGGEHLKPEFLKLPILLGNVRHVVEEHARAVNEAYGFINTFLQQNKYIASDNLSIADLSLINSVTNASVCVPLDEGAYPQIKAWRDRLKALPYYEINQTGGDLFKSAVKSKLG
ncbi:hypothetical protein NQ315_000746 [Exocentrus adspersus]|uniref:GST C-terminal domain-containing protein n=1 Tax=Exocentrus adspersus TaxID=1586481 RepID=A0AAV8WFT9_9CUCU|nr:hypothetical protein NQ315_000746 [Exocentrus adspersus]